MFRLSKWVLVFFVLLLALVALNFKTLVDNSRCAAKNTELSLKNDSIMMINDYLTNELKNRQQPCSTSGSLVSRSPYSASNSTAARHKTVK